MGTSTLFCEVALLIPKNESIALHLKNEHHAEGAMILGLPSIYQL